MLFRSWAFEASPLRFVDLFNACLHLGHHPWRTGTVVILPKPGKSNYSVAKAYCLITLLECCGKLLEKIVTSRILHDNLTHQLIPSSQFGSRDYSCAVNAAMCLTHNISDTLKSRNAGTLILFDIQGFFDNIHPGRLVKVFRDLGFPPSLVLWLESFLHDRSVSYQFNGFRGNPFDVDFSSPQGSPLSPIISAIYTSPLLRRVQIWIHKTLSLFIDDSSVYAASVSIRGAAATAISVVEEILGWLKRNGLCAAKEKTEFMSISPKHYVHHGPH